MDHPWRFPAGGDLCPVCSACHFPFCPPPPLPPHPFPYELHPPPPPPLPPHPFPYDPTLRRRCGALRLRGCTSPIPTSSPAGRGPTRGCAWARRPRSIRTSSLPRRRRVGLLWRAIGCSA
ncbi:unnamed protein product [Urochloa humidicola]